MTNEEFLALSQKELETIIDILKAKGADYTAGSSDPFANFRVCETLGLANAEIGVLVRMVDKIQRVKSFTLNGELKVKNESVQDALRDIIGYSLVLLGMVESKKGPTAIEISEAWANFKPEKSFKEVVEERKALADGGETDPTKFSFAQPFMSVPIENVNETINAIYKPSGAV